MQWYSKQVSVSMVDSAWAQAIGNVMSDGVGCGRSALLVSRPSSQLEATVLFLSCLRKLLMLGNQDSGVEGLMSKTSGQAGTGNAEKDIQCTLWNGWILWKGEIAPNQFIIHWEEINRVNYLCVCVLLSRIQLLYCVWHVGSWLMHGVLLLDETMPGLQRSRGPESCPGVWCKCDAFQTPKPPALVGESRQQSSQLCTLPLLADFIVNPNRQDPSSCPSPLPPI